MATVAQPPQISQNLKKDYLTYPEVIAQSISVIAPSTAPAAILGLIFVSAGNGTWLSFLLATVGLLFVCFNINQFARRSASPGSLYTYIVKGLGPTAGVLSGWALLLGYMVTGMSTLCGFAIFGQMLLGQLGLHLNILVLFALCVIVSYAIAYKDIKLSAKTMLIFEGCFACRHPGLGRRDLGTQGVRCRHEPSHAPGGHARRCRQRDCSGCLRFFRF
jgi:amino acid transporter